MGFFKKLTNLLAGGSSASSKHRILVVGLDNSGKSTILAWLKPKKAVQSEVVPTVGFQVEEFSKNGLAFTAFDMSGQGRYRNLWEHYYNEVGGIIFCIDSTDKIRMCVAKDELETMLAHQSLPQGVPIVFFANKMDRPQALSAIECVQNIELDKIHDKPWHIAQSNALTGEGLEEGINWLAQQMGRRQGRGKS
jgi:ADP-ribosylation factor-like protein 6